MTGTSIPIGLVAAAVVVIILALAAVLVLRGGPAPEQAVLGEQDAGVSGSPLPIAFGRELDPVTGAARAETTRFRPGDAFAYSVELPSRVGVRAVQVGVYRLQPSGSETTVQPPTAQTVDPGQTTIAFQVQADVLLATFGAGEYVMRIYRGDDLLAEGRFRLSE